MRVCTALSLTHLGEQVEGATPAAVSQAKCIATCDNRWQGEGADHDAGIRLFVV
jgi:hypothetical protein